jgi:hypothetical protein
MAQKISDGRPHRSERDLLARKIIPVSAYNSISDRIVARQPKRNVTGSEHSTRSDIAARSNSKMSR